MELPGVYGHLSAQKQPIEDSGVRPPQVRRLCVGSRAGLGVELDRQPLGSADRDDRGRWRLTDKGDDALAH